MYNRLRMAVVEHEHALLFGVKLFATILILSLGFILFAICISAGARLEVILLTFIVYLILAAYVIGWLCL